MHKKFEKLKRFSHMNLANEYLERFGYKVSDYGVNEIYETDIYLLWDCFKAYVTVKKRKNKIVGANWYYYQDIKFIFNTAKDCYKNHEDFTVKALAQDLMYGIYDVFSKFENTKNDFEL